MANEPNIKRDQDKDIDGNMGKNKSIGDPKDHGEQAIEVAGNADTFKRPRDKDHDVESMKNDPEKIAHEDDSSVNLNTEMNDSNDVSKRQAS